MKTRKKRLLRLIALPLAALTIILFSAAQFLRISTPRDILAFVGMATECHPIWKELAFRRLGPGDSFAATVSVMPPDHAEVLGEFACYDYGGGFTGLRIYTKDNKVVAAGAGSCTWDYTFFDTISVDDWDEINQHYTLARNKRDAGELGSDDLQESPKETVENVP